MILHQMKLHPQRLLIILLCLFFTVQSGFVFSGYAQSTPITLQNSDRVVFIGDGLFENELDYGYLEYVLTTAWPNRHVTFRNIGWSGDTPAGTSRDHFTNPPTAHDHLIEQIRAARPTVAMVGYGAHMAFENEDAIEGFMSDLQALLDTLETMDVRTILVSPAPHEPETSPATSIMKFNARLAHVSKQIAQAASSRSYPFVDLYQGLLSPANDAMVHISDNGFQLNAHGYYLAARVLEAQIQAPERMGNVMIDLKNKTRSDQIADLSAASNEVSFSLRAGSLPIPMPAKNRFETASQTLRVTGLRRGTYGVWIGNKKVASATANDLAQGILFSTPHTLQAQALQNLIYKKNRTYFYQYRPQNETYLVGFREYEQGNNARELQLLEPLIGEIENEIGRLRVPRDVSVRLTVAG